MKNIQTGCRVEVPLKNRKESLEGVVLSIGNSMPAYECREITRLVDKNPVINAEQIELAYWMKEYYLASLGECLYKMIPSGRRNKSSEPDIESFSELLSLNEEQKSAYEKVKSSFGTDSIHLLHGITGSGKTEVYIHLLNDLLKNTDKSAILLVPEISLTFQILKRLQMVFGNALAILHSGLRISEKFQNYMQLQRGEKRIAVGTRSGVFAPVRNLGLIIIDEEHDFSYKEHSSPRYHARQIAMQRCRTAKAPLLLGSATPSIESYYFALKGKIILHELKKRAVSASLPTVRIIQKKEDSEVISSELLFQLKKRLERKEQTVILLNRRGHSPLLYNRETRKFIECPNCTSNLCFHKKGTVICHLCGYTEKFAVLQKRMKTELELLGAGTQKLEEYILERFPDCRLERLDQDAAGNKDKVSEVIGRLIHRELDVLTGTQMIAKGLDASHVTLVGVVNSGIGLGLPDFRSGERIFSLLTQVAGRAGRADLPGEVIIEAYNTEHPVIRLAAEQNYKKFYESEIGIRKNMFYPPFSRLARLTVRGKKEEKIREFIETLGETLRKAIGREASENTFMLGPAECPFYRVDSNFRRHIILKTHDIQKIREILKKTVLPINLPSGLYLEIDIDPVDLV